MNRRAAIEALEKLGGLVGNLRKAAGQSGELTREEDAALDARIAVT